MTPRALILTIGATALALALAIGVAADSSFSDATPTTQVAVSTQESAPAAHLNNTDRGHQRLAAWNDPCVIAV
jgi:hypothetical protein